MHGKATTVTLTTILAAGILLRLLLLWTMWSADPERAMRPDSESYEDPALSLLLTGSFTSDPTPGALPEFKRTPGYPALIALVYSLSGQSRLALVLVQAVVLSALTGWCCYLSGKHLHSVGAGLAAAGFAMFGPVMIASNLTVMTETLFALLISLMLLQLVCFNKTKHLLFVAAGIGCTLAAATYVRPVSYYLILVLAPALFFLARSTRQKWQKSLAACLTAFLLCTIMLGAWHVRNLRHFGSTQFSGIAGINMLRYRAADLYARDHGISRPEASRDLLRKMEERTDLTGHQFDRELAFGLELLLKDIPGTIITTARGLIRSLSGPGAGSLVETVTGREMSTTAIIQDIFKNPLHFPVRHPWQTLALAWSLLFLVLLYMLGGVGMYRGIQEKSRRSLHVLLLLIVLYFLAVSSGAESYSRFRLAFLPVLAVYAGIGLTTLFSSRRHGSPPSLSHG